MAKIQSTSPRCIDNPTAGGAQLKQWLKDGRVLLGGIIGEMPRPLIAKIYRWAGFDFIYIENEHIQMAGLPALADFVLTARDNGLPVIAKIPELERSETGRLLEAGVVGIQLPRTESRAQLEELIDYVKFPPLGSRAGAPCYGNVEYADLADPRAWIEEANRSTVIVAHIETRKGLENFEQIVTTPHLDMVYVGPYDFSISMGQPGNYDHPEVAAGMQRIAALCRKHHVAFGTTASGPEAAAKWVAEGCQFFETIDELTLIKQGAAATVDAYRAACAAIDTRGQG